MAETNLVFNTDQNETLCFMCAVKLIMSPSDEKINVYPDTTNYEFSECDHCEEFIYGKITI